jgi:hypothetical protein
MRWFLEYTTSRSLPIFFGNRTRQEHQGDFEKLVKKKVLVRSSSNLAEIDCELCDEGHQCQIRENNGHLFYVCENGAGRKEISDKDAALFEYDDDAFRKLLADELGLKTDGTGSKDARYLGQYQGQKMKAKVVYLRTDEDVARGGFDAGPSILVSNVGIAGTGADGVFYCALADILTPSSSKNIFDKTAFEKNIASPKRVFFDKKNGHLYLDGKRIYTASLTGPEFRFLSYLWDNWEKQLPYRDIHQFVRGKMGKDVADNPPNFCAKMKSNIKNTCKTIDKIITIPTRGRFMMADPA